MKKTQDILQSLGVEARYFRPPYGRYTQQTVAQAEALGMTIMLWSLDSQDWKRHVSRLEGLRSVSPTAQQSFPGMRGVFLFHDTHKHTVDEMADILDALLAGGCEGFVTVSEYMLRVPREEEHRLSTQAPHEGRGEMPPSDLAGEQQALPAGSVPPGLSEQARHQRPSGERMRTQPAHPVRILEQGALSFDMPTQPAHGVPGGPAPTAVPEALMMGIVTDGQAQPGNPVPPAGAGLASPGAPQPRDGQRQSASFSLMRAAPSVAPQQRAPAAAKGQIPQLLSTPGVLLPAHKTNRDTRDIGRGDKGSG